MSIWLPEAIFFSYNSNCLHEFFKTAGYSGIKSY